MTESLPDLAVDPLNLPKAAADQLTVQPFEGGLLALARVAHPTVSWWHGYRKTNGNYGSQCYVCDQVIVAWGGNSGPSMAARTVIEEHKNSHRDGNLPAGVTTETKGKQS